MEKNIKKFKLHPVQILSLGFAIVILIGAILLSLPISSVDNNYTNFLDALFTSTSAVCVTGLITIDTGTYWNAFGQCVILMLIEIGGLGFMSLTTFIAVLLGKKITLRDRLIMQEAMNTFKIEGLIKMLQYVLGFTIIIQLAGAVLLSTQFIPQLGLSKGIFFSIFHSVSEYKNPETLGMMNAKDKLLNAYFAAVTPRTAGFNSISTDGMSMAGKFITIILMFIGGSPGSTAGGLKTTTVGILVLTVICVLKGREETEAFGRRFSKETVYKSFTIVAVGVMWVVIVTLMLTILEPQHSFINLFYEAASAFGTAGLSTGVTQSIGGLSKILLIMSMYIGRVGPLTVLFAIINRNKKKGYKYPEGKILIG